MTDTMNLRAGSARSPVHSRFEELLGDYTTLPPEDRKELIELFGQLSSVEMALVMSDDRLAGLMGRFRAEQKSALRAPFSHYAIFVALGITSLGILLYGFLLAAS